MKFNILKLKLTYAYQIDFNNQHTSSLPVSQERKHSANCSAVNHEQSVRRISVGDPLRRSSRKWLFIFLESQSSLQSLCLNSSGTPSRETIASALSARILRHSSCKEGTQTLFSLLWFFATHATPVSRPFFLAAPSLIAFIETEKGEESSIPWGAAEDDGLSSAVSSEVNRA